MLMGEFLDENASTLNHFFVLGYRYNMCIPSLAVTPKCGKFPGVILSIA